MKNHHGWGATTVSLDIQLILSIAGIQQAAARPVAKMLAKLAFCPQVHLQTYWQIAAVT
ncbi:TPA: hypothetical protein ACPZRY_001771 [Yersinia enterocolitica]|uniref:hypothetical protein n=1 Tax=Yersinia enterocolitica TaxID=630 RepID=UPI003301FB73|nr:hypothetical protein [Yersinia enterocolitica]EKN4809277.1 hypothetical protein [Yersinia enterocolitica]HDL7328761.1 hypothetical protein [Yersinia enterocolitica]HDL7354087.1 hypothetical protein [Yersinia enterocolitica]HDL7958902.1 hypothetical protein [Yersinia enterocolitica]